MIPCLTEKSIRFLYGTADERYNYSNEFFRKTHFPQTLNRYFKNRLIESVSEEALLNELEEDHTFGNRIFVIFGSTGSGKSELLCWIKDQWQLKNHQRPMIRISRNELNPQLLVKKCYEAIGLELNDLIIDENKWDLLMNKPITIVNQMVWATMSEIFESDHEIVPATLLLRPIIEKNILEFTKQIRDGHVSKPLEIISQKEYETLLESTTIKIDIHYNKFRNSLLQKFDQFLFQGMNLKEIFKQLSQKLAAKKIRPVLLIDDLVQSINLYAADLLDFFITLEEGYWDVLIGLTPGVEQGNDFNQELIDRIKNLDTIDDRVKKLWLSDESGSNFFTLEKDKAQHYLQNYILALKEANGFTCTTHCPHANSCHQLLKLEDEDNQLLPFNIPLINRIYDGIPKGKGSLRYLILHSRELLKFLIKGDTKQAMKINNMLNRDVFVAHEDKAIKLLGEMFAGPEQEVVLLTSPLLKHFRFESGDLTLRLKKLNQTMAVPNDDIVFKKRTNINPHIRDWVEGNKVKEELLEPVRSGVATIVHEIVKGTSIVRERTARVSKAAATIQRSEIVKRYKYPIAFDEPCSDHINIDKNINLLQIANFQQVKMQDRGAMFAKVANDRNVSEWVYQSHAIKTKWLMELKENLGLPVDQFAFYFKFFISNLNRLANSDWTSSIINPIKKDWVQLSEDLFLDWFSLRDNIVDFSKMNQINIDFNFEEYFMALNPSKILNHFQIKTYPLKDFILEVQREIKQYHELLIPIALAKVNEILSWESLFENSASELFVKIKPLHTLKKHSLTLSDMMFLEEMIQLLSSDEFQEMIRQKKNQQMYLGHINKLVPLLVKEESDLQEIDNIDIMEIYLRDKLELRSQVRKHLMRLVLKGETQLPQKQWKGILRDLEEMNPEFFDHIVMNINMRN